MADLDSVQMHELVDRYVRGEISAEDYYAAVDKHAEQWVEDELRSMSNRRRG